MSQEAHDLYCKITDEFDKILAEHLGDKDQNIKDYVETRILDEYRPWNYMHTTKKDKS